MTEHAADNGMGHIPLSEPFQRARRVRERRAQRSISESDPSRTVTATVDGLSTLTGIRLDEGWNKRHTAVSLAPAVVATVQRAKGVARKTLIKALIDEGLAEQARLFTDSLAALPASAQSVREQLATLLQHSQAALASTAEPTDGTPQTTEAKTQFATLARQLQTMATDMLDVTTQLSTGTVTGSSADGNVRAVLDYDGKLTSLRIDQMHARKATASVLSADILAAVAAGQRAIAERFTKLVSPFITNPAVG